MKAPKDRRLLVLLASAILYSCAIRRPQPLAMSFLPPVPQGPQPEFVLSEAPSIPPSPFWKPPPPFLMPEVEPAPEVDLRILKAEEHFQAGKKHSVEGDWDAAREEFNSALESLAAGAVGLSQRARLEARFRQLVESIHAQEVEEQARVESNREPVFDKAPLEDILPKTFPIEPRLKFRVQSQIDATVSQLPLEVSDTVLGYIHYFSTTRGRKTLLAGLRRSGRYAPMIHRILDEEGIPREMLYLAQAESGFFPRAVSRKRATGMWQFIKFRGQEYGLRQTPHTDDRLDPEKATRAAARHLRDLYRQFGDWYLAMAAYNCGPGVVERAVQRTGYADFWQMRQRNVLPRETSNYVPIVLAITIMVKNPKDYGLEDREADSPLEYDTVEMVAPTQLALIADVAGQPVALLQQLNPAILRGLAPAGYPVHVPKGAARQVMAGLEPIPPAQRAWWRMHRLAAGETIAELARRFKTTQQSILAANPASAEPGDLLVIPVAAGKSATAARSTPAAARRSLPAAVRKTRPAAQVAMRRPPAARAR